MGKGSLRVGIVGLGYISSFHLRAINASEQAKLIGVCDASRHALSSFADRQPEVDCYDDLDRMLDEAQLDVVHVLTQPDSHAIIAEKCLRAGCHVIIEKPVATSLVEATRLNTVAREEGVCVFVNHNFIFSRPLLRLREVLSKSELGPIKSVRVIWKKHLALPESGPWNSWMLRDPKNMLWETGSHLFSELLTVLDTPTIESVSASMPKELPSGADFYQRWNIRGTSRACPFSIEISYDPGYEQHAVEVEGMFGVAVADIENEIFLFQRSTGHEYDLERLHVNARLGLSRSIQAVSTFARYAYSKLSNKIAAGPFDFSMLHSIENSYKEISGSESLSGNALEFALKVSELCEQSAVCSKLSSADVCLDHPNQVGTPGNGPKALIVGASGFIGKRLIQELQNRGISLRAIVRNGASLLDVPLDDQSEVLVGNYQDAEFMRPALQGIDTVFHLAVAHSNSFEGYINGDLEPMKQFVELCSDSGVRRFIYTGTIDSVYLGPGAGTVTEAEGIDPKINRRNNYARCKAMAEQWLKERFEEEGFPVVIFRPAIVVGAGGPIDHLGVAKWFGIGRCEYWGDGNHPLPLVLVEDVVSAMASAIDAPGIEGKTYNLSSVPLMSARDYVSEVEDCLGATIATSSSSAVKHWLVDLMKWSVKVMVRHADRKRVPSLRDWRCREQHAVFDSSCARRDLGWEPTESREVLVHKGIRDVAEGLMNTHGRGRAF